MDIKEENGGLFLDPSFSVSSVYAISLCIRLEGRFVHHQNPCLLIYLFMLFNVCNGAGWCLPG